MPPQHVAVIGGGLTGLSAAYRLAPKAKVTLLEASNHLGGWVSSPKEHIKFTSPSGEQVESDVTLESGPRSIRPKGLSAASMLKLILDVGLEGSIVGIPKTSPAARNRFIMNNATGKLMAAPTSPLALLSPRTPAPIRELLLGVMKEPFRRNSPSAADDESVHSFFLRRFGPKVAATASAFVHGIYAADPSTLSVRSAFQMLWDYERGNGSLVLGMLKGDKAAKAKELEAWKACGAWGDKRKDWAMYALRGGMSELTDRLALACQQRGVDVTSGTRVNSITPLENGVKIDSSIGPIEADHVVAAVTPRHLSSILSKPLPNLTANRSTTVGVVNVVFPLPPSKVHPEGFGFLIPASDANRAGVLGVIFDSTALPGTEVPELEGKITKVTAMMGGPYWSSYKTGGSVTPVPSKEELSKMAVDYLKSVFPHLTSTDPILTKAYLQVDCIPTYAPGHGTRMRQLHEAIQSGPWQGKLSVGGSGYGGVSVNDCVYSGEILADAVGFQTGLERWKDWN